MRPRCKQYGDSCQATCSGLYGGGAGSNKYWEHDSFDCSETQACRYRIKLTADIALCGMQGLLNLTAS